MSKSQINLPKTAFSMKANLSVREPEILEYWKKIDLYKQLRAASKGKEKFVLHDGISRSIILPVCIEGALLTRPSMRPNFL